MHEQEALPKRLPEHRPEATQRTAVGVVVLGVDQVELNLRAVVLGLPAAQQRMPKAGARSAAASKDGANKDASSSRCVAYNAHSC